MVQNCVGPFLKIPVTTSERKRMMRQHLLESNQHLLEEIVDFEDDMLALTYRELQVFLLVKDGFTNKEIGRILGISYRTVECHKSRLREKLDVRSTGEATSKFASYFTWLTMRTMEGRKT